MQNPLKATSLVAVAVLSLSLMGTVAQAQTSTTTPKPPTPKISAKQAAAIAAKKIGGKAAPAKYEFEDNRWQYAVVVTDKKGQMFEVEVNSTTGAVIATEKTSAADEAKEAAADKKKATGKKMEKAEKGEKGEADEKDEKPKS